MTVNAKTGATPKTLNQLPTLKVTHVNALTDDTGMLQHAIFTIPNRAEGYTTDDNARALIFTVLLAQLGKDKDKDKDQFGNPELNRDDGACPVLPPPQSPSPPVEPPGHVAVVVSTMARPMIAKSTIAPSVREWEWRDRPAGWPSWRTALTVVSAVLLALVLSYGVRQTNKASAQSSGPAPTEKVSPSTGVSLSSAVNPKKDPGKVSALAVSPPAIKSEQNSDQTPKESHVATAGATTAGSGATVSRRHGDDLIAPDTVTYFDQHTFDEPASRAETSQRSAGRHPSSRTQGVGGVIAANTITLNDKPAPKGAKQESDIKHYSDLK